MLPKNKQSSIQAGFAIWLPKDIPLIFVMMAALQVKRPNWVFGSRLPKLAGYSIVPTPIKLNLAFNKFIK
jgi:hypothetical protein